MKTFTLIIFLFLSGFSLNAQDYLINFSGTGSSTLVETVTVENLTQAKSITLSGSKNLHLMGTVTENTPLLEYMDYPLIVYPNPSSGDLTIQFETQKLGSATIVLFNIAGREVVRVQQRVQNGFQSFKIEGLGNGVYTVHVLLEDQKFAKKVICYGKSSTNTKITFNGSSVAKQKITTLKSASDEQLWQYNNGDLLKFQGISGKYSTIVMDVPTQSKALSFNFVGCTDADGNNYPVVQIGNQLWMAENLKTTKYSDGTPIPTETDNLKWAYLTDGAYCWQNNDINNKATFGALYNWHAIGSTKLAPTGWHVASNLEWADLINYVGGENIANDKVAGDKMKESGVKHWVRPNTTATNEFGFSALPGGIRLVSKPDNLLGSFQNLGVQCVFWSNSDIDNSYAWGKGLSYSVSSAERYWSEKQTGYSVRCIKNVQAKPTPKFISKAPMYKYPNNTVGQIKNGHFMPGFYVTDDFAQNMYDISGIYSEGESRWAGSYFRFNDNNSIYFDYNNDGILDMFAFMCNFRDEPWGSKSGKYMLVKDVLSSNPEIKYIDCTTRFTALFELNDLNNDGINEIIEFGNEGHQLFDGSHGDQAPFKIISFLPDGNFTIKEIGEPASQDVKSGDVDNDGDIDLLVWRYNSNKWIDQWPMGDAMPMLYLNDGNGNFTLQDSYKTFDGLEEIIKIHGQYIGLASLFDLNNDGFLDLVVGQNIKDPSLQSTKLDYYTPNCRIYWGTGTFDFNNNFSELPNTSIKDLSMPNSVMGFSFLDYDQDGDYDVIVSVEKNVNYGWYIQLYENLGNKTFKDVTEPKILGFYHAASTPNKDGDFPSFYNNGIFDIDDDGDFDIIPKNVSSWTMFEYSPNMYWENIGRSFVRRNM